MSLLVGPAPSRISGRLTETISSSSSMSFSSSIKDTFLFCQLFRALGQGAFGEVYQGMLKSKNEPSETNVAVKTLPELSTNQGKINIP